jgi:tetratricopeptide (TPR) repeat protein
MGESGTVPRDLAAVRQRAVEASERGRPATAARLLRPAVAAVERGDAEADPDLHARLLISLAHAEAETGQVDEGLQLLDRALGGGPTAETRGLWHGQRGLLLVRAGRYRPALADLQAAEPLLRGAPAERARVLLNRGVLHLGRGALDRADADFRTCHEVAAAAGLPLLDAKATADEGYVAYLRGDLPRALAALDAAAPVLHDLAPGAAAVNDKDRADVLLAAGLLEDADEALRRAVRPLAAARLRQDRAEAELSLSTVARLRGRPAEARRWAHRALVHFRERGATAWGLLAELAALHVDVTRTPERCASPAGDLAARLARLGLREEAATARWLQVAALARAGHAEQARTLARKTRSSGTGIATRMLAHEARALVATADGDPAAAQRARRTGLTELAAYQSRLGSVDLLTGASRIGRTLAREGLAEALRDGRTPAVLDWSERVRAAASRIPPVRPPEDAELAAALARLRWVRGQEHAARLAGQAPEPSLRAEARSLEHAVRTRSWQRPGSLRVERPAPLGRVREVLGADGVLLSLMGARGTVHALVVTARGARVRRVGTVRGVRETVLRLRADLDMAASPLPGRLRSAVLASLATGLAVADGLAADALAGVDTGGPVVVVPAGLSAQLPWSALPVLRGRPVTVAPSATWWVARHAVAGGQGQAAGSGPDDGTAAPPAQREVHVAGPGVARAVEEVRACARGAPSARVLTGDTATVAAVLRAADGAQVLHVAAHGAHEADNPLFSSLLLADGSLVGHDLDALSALPRDVVLSACETGRSSIRPGDEALGMTAAFLHGGSRSVVASVARIGDETAARVAVAHHEALRRGLSPAQALALAVGDVGPGEAVPVACFGAGW